MTTIEKLESLAAALCDENENMSIYLAIVQKVEDHASEVRTIKKFTTREDALGAIAELMRTVFLVADANNDVMVTERLERVIKLFNEEFETTIMDTSVGRMN